ncbi:hypothetical protein ACR0S4_17870 [Priestia megaterium]|uniref:hypothetical protein n=1 Tax=Priestia megaterium TaxID=1404 RepID=UPI003D99E0A1
MKQELNDFLVNRQKQKNEENEKIDSKKKQHLDYFKSLYRQVKEWMVEMEEHGVASLNLMKKALASSELAGFYIEFKEETIHFIPLRIDYEKDEQIKVIIKLSSSTVKNKIVNGIELVICGNNWWLIDQRPNHNINAKLNEDNFSDVIISLLKK